MKSLEIVGLSGLYLFSFTAVLGIAGANIGLLLMLIAMLPQLPEVWRRYRSSRVVLCILLGVVYIIASAAAAAYFLPETLSHQWDQVLRWGDLSLILLVAWWLKDDPKRFYISFVLFAAGAFVRIFTFMPWDSIWDVLDGSYRPWGFGLWHISFSSYLVVILLGLFLFARRWILSVTSRWGRLLVFLLLLFSLLICIEAILISKSRGTWLAALLVLPVVLLLYSRTLLRSKSGLSMVRIAAAAGVVVVLLGFVFSSQLSGVLERATQEQETYRSLLEDDVSKVPTSSVGIRIHLWHYGVQKWLERPLFGWGTGTEAYLMEKKWESGIYGDNSYTPPHFHNIYLELLVRFGLFGLLVVASVIWLIYRQVWIRYRAGELPADWFYFLTGTLFFSMVWGCFDMRIVKWDYRDFVLLFFGAALIMSRPFAEKDFFRKMNQERM
ncbi:MAG TPA: O-antigen ligase domain-containing protein [Gammaproteobacteria bacterium]|nr:O-antigen ligase domain-containing protein [Gammaproteobacteria bacterium]